jgi:hypothetical protein
MVKGLAVAMGSLSAPYTIEYKRLSIDRDSDSRREVFPGPARNLLNLRLFV